jgi:hypothetical protein
MRLQWAGHVDRIRETRNACRILSENYLWKLSHGRPKRRSEDDINLDLRVTGFEENRWTELSIVYRG